MGWCERGAHHEAKTTSIGAGGHGWRSRVRSRQEDGRTRIPRCRPDEQPPEEAEAQSEPAVAEDAAPAVGDDDMVTRLTQLKELHDSGVLTDEEFAAEKEKVLSGG